MEREIWEIVKALDEKKLTAIEAHKKLCNLYDVIKSVCTCENSEKEKDSLVPVYCNNCNAYVQTVF